MVCPLALLDHSLGNRVDGRVASDEGLVAASIRARGEFE
jgi:hypothetical protein